MKYKVAKHRIASWVLMGALSAGAAAYAEDIPVSRVILSTSGLAQFEHKTQVTGTKALEFPVRLEQVDDILKSLVVFDMKGRLGGVTLPGKQPLDQIFKDLPFNRGQLTSAMMLLNAYQGAVLTVKGKDYSITGKIIQVTPENIVHDDDKSMTKHRVSLMTEAGMRSALLEDLQSIQFADEKIRGEIARALDSIRENSTSERRMLTVNLLGEETRDVKLSYVVEAPLWKTAYRMVVPEAGDEKGLLQGWAVVENMTASDWNKVDLSLVSGNPVTFRQALYESYYVSRPELPVQVFGRVMPRVDQGTITTAGAKQSNEMDSYREGKMERRGRRDEAMLEKSVMGGLAAPASMAMADMAYPAEEASFDGMNAIAQRAEAAQSAEATTQVLFRFPDRFTLKSGQSMMVPFVSRSVPMEKISLYQPDTNAKHPLAAVEIVNDGETGIPAGVLTLYEESKLLKGTSFVGDAQMPMLAQGEKRLISYALDSKTKIDREDKSTSTETQFTADRGVMRVQVKQVHETTYTIKAPAKEDRTIVIEHPRMGGDYKVIEPDPKDVEVTDTHYRLKTKVKAGETKPLKLLIENDIWQSYSIDAMSTEELLAYASSRGKLSPETRKIFEELASLRRSLDEIDGQLRQIDEKKEILFRDQERLRENLKSLDNQSAVGKKYLDKLNEQEDQITELDSQRAKLAAERMKRLTALQEEIATMKF